MSRSAKKTQAIIQFDYDALQLNQRSIVQQRTGEIRERLQRSAQDIWEIGQKLTDVRNQLKHGQFDLWLKAEFNWSRRTAYNFINVYESFRERANFAHINIAASALYLLAAPSTPQAVRDEYLQLAGKGKKVTHQELQRVIKKDKPKSEPRSTTTEPSKAAAPRPEIITVIPQASEVEMPFEIAQSLEQQSATQSFPAGIQPGWYWLGKQHLLFYGDTASSQFSTHLPEVVLAVAITSKDWDHDWLIDRARTVIILPEAGLRENLVEQLLLTFSNLGETVVFPWLPSQDIIAAAHTLGRRVFAGDSSLERCSKAIAYLGLKVEQASHLPRVKEI